MKTKERMENEREASENIKAAFFDEMPKEMPPADSIWRWKRIAEREKHIRAVNARRTVFAAAIVVCIFAAAWAYTSFSLPKVEAEQDTDNSVKQNLQTMDTYKSKEEVPAEVRDGFVTAGHVPEGFLLNRICVEGGSNATKITEVYENSQGEEISLNEVKAQEENRIDSSFASWDVREMWAGREVFMWNYEEKKVYAFEEETLIIHITAAKNIEKEEIKKMAQSLQGYA